MQLLDAKTVGTKAYTKLFARMHVLGPCGKSYTKLLAHPNYLHARRSCPSSAAVASARKRSQEEEPGAGARRRSQEEEPGGARKGSYIGGGSQEEEPEGGMTEEEDGEELGQAGSEGPPIGGPNWSQLDLVPHHPFPRQGHRPTPRDAQEAKGRDGPRGETRDSS